MSPSMRVLVRFAASELLRDGSAWITAALLGLACAGATSNGIRWVSSQQRALAEAQTHQVAKLDAARRDGEAILAGRTPAPAYWLNPADVRGFAYYEMVAYATKPIASAAALTIGSSDLLPSYVRVTANSTTPFAQAYELENPHRLALGRLDATFVVIFLLPLAIAALGYHVLATDWESGRLALLVMHGVTAQQLVVARLGVRLALVMVVCLTAIVGPLWWSAGIHGTISTVIVWFTVALAYATLWTAATGAVVARARRQAAAAALLGAIWVVVALIVPWTMSVMADLAFPSPSRVEQILRERAELDRVEAAGASAVVRYVTEHPEMGVAAAGAQDTYTAQQIAINGAVEATLASTDAALEEQLARRQALVDSLSWLSPPVVATEAMVDLAGTGWRRHHAFLYQGREYVAALRRYFNPKALRGEFVFREWDGWPQFAWREPSFAPAIRRAFLAALGLGVMAVMVAVWTKRRLASISLAPHP